MVADIHHSDRQGKQHDAWIVLGVVDRVSAVLDTSTRMAQASAPIASGFASRSANVGGDSAPMKGMTSQDRAGTIGSRGTDARGRTEACQIVRFD
jgi:hypothetical protein